jgi:hemerythrin
MALLTWDNSYSVGVIEFDNHHKRLLELLNSLHAAMAQGKGNQILGPILDDLLSYTVFHFSAEERFMQQNNYGNFLTHKLEHDQLTKQVKDFQRDFQAGKITVTNTLMNFLKDWLTKHILSVDKKYGVLAAR